VNHDHQHGEQHQAFQHVAMGAGCAPGPAGQFRQRLAIAGEARQADLERRARDRHDHLHHAERDGPDQQLKIGGIIHRHVGSPLSVT
jgi:hypothetical protein